MAKIDRVVAGVPADCGQAGIKAALIISAGFSEVGNCAGEDKISRVARQYGLWLTYSEIGEIDLNPVFLFPGM